MGSGPVDEIQVDGSRGAKLTAHPTSGKTGVVNETTETPSISQLAEESNQNLLPDLVQPVRLVNRPDPVILPRLRPIS